MKQTVPIDVEELTTFLRQKATTERFKLPWNYEDSVFALTAAYRSEVESRHRLFIEDGDTRLHIQAMARWLTDDKPQFGIILCGQCGNGKTTLSLAVRTIVQFVSRGAHGDSSFFSKTLRQVNARQICDYVKSNPKEYKGLCRDDMLSIDDLGTEPTEVLDYGNVLNPVIDLLTSRYNDQLFTIVTTNLNPQQIREHYGNRIADRFNEMFERIVFNNPSYRTPHPPVACGSATVPPSP